MLYVCCCCMQSSYKYIAGRRYRNEVVRSYSRAYTEDVEMFFAHSCIPTQCPLTMPYGWIIKAMDFTSNKVISLLLPFRILTVRPVTPIGILPNHILCMSGDIGHILDVPNSFDLPNYSVITMLLPTLWICDHNLRLFAVDCHCHSRSVPETKNGLVFY